MIAIILIESSEYITLSKIADTIYVSRTTIINDLGRVKEYLKSANLTVISHANKGLRLDGLGSDKRSFLLNIILSNQDNKNLISSINSENLLLKSDMDKINRIINEQEHAHEKYLTDSSYLKLKPNSEEMENLLGVSINNREEVINSAVKLYEMGIEIVVVSLGKDGALLVCKDGVYHGKPPKINVVNTVGCGDSMVAAFAVAMERAYSNIDSLKYAISISAANAMTFSTGNFNSEDADNILENIIIEKIYK